MALANWVRRLIVTAVATCSWHSSVAAADTGWPHYGADQGGRRYSEAAEITPKNVTELRGQWLYRTGDVARRDPALMQRIKFQTTPILVDDKLVLCTPFSEVIALDPGDGHELWRHDPHVATDRRPANRYNCRGVAAWRATRPSIRLLHRRAPPAALPARTESSPEPPTLA